MQVLLDRPFDAPRLMRVLTICTRRAALAWSPLFALLIAFSVQLQAQLLSSTPSSNVNSQMAKVWSLSLVIDGVMTLTGPGMTTVMTYSGFALNFDANSDRSSPKVDLSSVKGSFNYEIHWIVTKPGAVVTPDRMSFSGTEITDAQLSLTRKLTYDRAPELNIDDGNSIQPAGTLDINGNVMLHTNDAAIPLNWRTVATPLHVRVNYGDANPISATVQMVPGPGPTIQGSVRATVNRKMGRIKIREVSGAGMDLTRRPDCAKGKSYTRGTAEESVNYLFDNPTRAAFIHANVQITVTAADGSDITSQYTAQRFMRDWVVPLKGVKGGGDPRDIDGGTSARAGPLPPANWGADGKSWFDVPGSMVNESTHFLASREIQEFLYSAKNNSDIITPSYYLVVTDTRPPHWYRIRVYQQHDVTLAQYVSIRSSSAPWRNEGGDATVFDSHWVNKDVIVVP